MNYPDFVINLNDSSDDDDDFDGDEDDDVETQEVVDQILSNIAEGITNDDEDFFDDNSDNVVWEAEEMDVANVLLVMQRGVVEE